MKLATRTSRYLVWAAVQAAIWLVRLPIILVIKLVHFWAVRPLLGDSIVCATCRTRMSLLGLWECGTCTYSFYGFYFARCECCGAVPGWLECQRCGASTMNPLIFG
jgi:hypothetical protein